MKGRKNKTNSVQVAVRVRPLNKRELKIKDDNIIDMKDSTTYCVDPETGQRHKYTFDFSYWSIKGNPESPFCDQETIYNDLGNQVLDNAFEGYNSCIFAYGQTGSGKSYSQYGTNKDPGIIPRLCEELFQRLEAEKQKKDSNILSFRVEVSMVEIYNEKVRDLFNPTNPRNERGLKVRENPRTGPYVQGLTKNVVTNYPDMKQMLEEGSKLRTIGATNMNDRSSRAHTIFQVILTQIFKWKGKKKGVSAPQGKTKHGQRVAKINLIDLAGSERQGKAQTKGKRLKEGSAINLSLSMLGNVINKLADLSSGKGNNDFVPYRNSTLTWLLKESLGGNSRTVMIATISPAASNFPETLSTLRYANRAKEIQNHAKVNEDPQSKLINELRKEIERLKELLKARALNRQSGGENEGENENDEDDEGRLMLLQQLQESEKMIQLLSMSEEERVEQTYQVAMERKRVLEEAGVSAAFNRQIVPHIINLNEDPSLSENLLYFFKPDDITRIGSVKQISALESNDIVLQGEQVVPQHCKVDNRKNKHVYLVPPSSNAKIYVNGKPVRKDERIALHTHDRIVIGLHHVFRFANPNDVRKCDHVIDWEFVKKEIEEQLSLSIQQKQKRAEERIEAHYNERHRQEEVMIQKLAQEREKLKLKLERMRMDNVRRKKEGEDRMEEIQKLEEAVGGYQQKLQDEISSREKLATESQLQGKTVADMRKSVENLRGELKKQREEKEEMEKAFQREKQELEREKQNLGRRMNDLETKLIRIREEKKQDEAAHHQQQQKLKELMANVGDLKTQLEDESEKVRQIQKKSQELKESGREWKTKHELTKQLLVQKTEEQARLLPVIQNMIQDQDSTYRKQIDILQVQIKEQQQQWNKMRTLKREEIMKLKSRNNEGHSDFVEKLMKDLDRLIQEKSELEQKIQKKRRENSQIPKFKAKIYEFEMEIRRLKTANDQLDGLKRDRGEIIEALKTSLKEMNRNFNVGN